MNESERNAILVQYLPDIYHYSCNHFLKDSEAAREHTHDTIVKALECWDRYNPARWGRKAWLLTIAKNLALKKRTIPCCAASRRDIFRFEQRYSPGCTSSALGYRPNVPL